MGRKKKEFPPSKEVNFHFRMTKELYEVLQTEAASADASAFLLRDARHATHDILLLRISAILPEAISDGGLTPTTDTNLFLATYRGGNHLTSDILTCQLIRLFSI